MSLKLDKLDPKLRQRIADQMRREDAFKNETHRPIPSAKSEPIVRDEPVRSSEGKEKSTGRFLVRIVSFRAQLCDPDNLCPKYLVDCLRYSEIIPNDRPEDIELQVSQIKCESKGLERTEIEIVPLNQ